MTFDPEASFGPDDDDTLMPAGPVERRGSDRLSDLTPADGDEQQTGRWGY